MFHVVLVEPEIPQNTGNIGRLCLATHSTLHLVHPLGFELNDAALKRAGMDYWQKLKVIEHRSFSQFLAQASGARLYYCSTKAKQPYWEVKFQPGDYLVFGRESKGLPEELLEKNPDKVVCVPMPNKDARSLNLATAVAAVLYEGLRQHAVE